jgi:hypothetical protein
MLQDLSEVTYYLLKASSKVSPTPSESHVFSIITNLFILIDLIFFLKFNRESLNNYKKWQTTILKFTFKLFLQ